MISLKKVGMLAILCMGVFSVAVGCSSNQKTAAAASETKTQTVQELATIPTSSSLKEEPVQFNGQIRKVAYLTFDDGPGKFTAQVLDILKQNNIKATFFLIGSHAEQYKDLVQREVKEGNYVGMHSMSHDYKKLYVQGDFVNEMEEDQQLIKKISGVESHLVRPPYGSMPGLNQQLRDKVADAHLKIWDWTIDSLDWKYNKVPADKSVPAIVQNVVSQAKGNREVILMHDIHQQSLDALPAVIKAVKDKGYEFEVYSDQEHFSLNFWHDNRL
ncbi:polysaccharide deacetylase family protein [Ectobacillus sp. sgz5001026]|uniref:polysaccharide deacetylase family protein n=1 Tax=Ectobacillus sp. sgz5001026 TaxID=3242473 RepID=UPI0036D35FF3